jgi:hypothetical protein
MEIERNVKRFNKVMEQLVDEHRMFKKLADVHFVDSTILGSP